MVIQKKGHSVIMFKRRIIFLIIAFTFMLGFLIWKWNEASGLSLETEAGLVSAQRWTQDLRGTWNSYPSLRQAMAAVTEGANHQNKFYALTAGGTIDLPSTQRFHVAVKRFQISSDWSARSVLLQIRGVNGEGSIYLNGIDSAHRIGQFANDGGAEEFLLPANLFHYGEDNLLFIETSAPPLQRNTLWGLSWPSEGQIKGSLQLVATMETSLTTPQVNVQWDQDNATVTVKTRINHHQVSEYGPWDIQGVISDGSSGIATASAQVQVDESPVQDVNLTFSIPHARRWTISDPFSYQLYLTIMNPKGDKDDISVNLNLSSITFQQEKFVLNGQAFAVKGITLSPEQEAQIRHTGKTKDWLIEQKGKGYNLIYFIGPFPDEVWLESADKIGMGIWAELPAKMIPGNRLPNPSIWGTLIQEESIHPSLWAWSLGTGLEVDPRVNNASFLENVQNLTQPLPVFMAHVTGAKGQTSVRNIQLTEKGFSGTWGDIANVSENQTNISAISPQEKLIIGFWAVWVLIVVFANIGIINWRYKEINERKPKRPLRRAWHWQGLALLSRETTLAGIVTSLLFHTQVPWAVWFPGQWPLWDSLKQQPPLLIWLLLSLFLILIRLLQMGVAAPHMPEEPEPLGLAMWLERRYRWIWIPALLWAAEPWGVPGYLPLAVYAGLTLLFFPLRLRDVHRIQGRYRPLAFVPGIFFLSSVLWIAWRWTDAYYLWYLIIALRG